MVEGRNQKSKVRHGYIVGQDQPQLPETLPQKKYGEWADKSTYQIPCDSHRNLQKRLSDSCFTDEEVGAQSEWYQLNHKQGNRPGLYSKVLLPFPMLGVPNHCKQPRTAVNLDQHKITDTFKTSRGQGTWLCQNPY